VIFSGGYFNPEMAVERRVACKCRATEGAGLCADFCAAIASAVSNQGLGSLGNILFYMRIAQ
jgi:hypothetical protein